MVTVQLVSVLSTGVELSFSLGDTISLTTYKSGVIDCGVANYFPRPYACYYYLIKSWALKCRPVRQANCSRDLGSILASTSRGFSLVLIVSFAYGLERFCWEFMRREIEEVFSSTDRLVGSSGKYSRHSFNLRVSQSCCLSSLVRLANLTFWFGLISIFIQRAVCLEAFWQLTN